MTLFIIGFVLGIIFAVIAMIVLDRIFPSYPIG